MTDDDLDEVRDDSAPERAREEPEAVDRRAREPSASQKPAAAENPSIALEPAEEPSGQSLFEKPAALRAPSVPDDSGAAERPSLFVKPASLGGPGPRKTSHDGPSSRGPAAREEQPADEGSPAAGGLFTRQPAARPGSGAGSGSQPGSGQGARSGSGAGSVPADRSGSGAGSGLEAGAEPGSGPAAQDTPPAGPSLFARRPAVRGRPGAGDTPPARAAAGDTEAEGPGGESSGAPLPGEGATAGRSSGKRSPGKRSPSGRRPGKRTTGGRSSNEPHSSESPADEPEAVDVPAEPGGSVAGDDPGAVDVPAGDGVPGTSGEPGAAGKPEPAAGAAAVGEAGSRGDAGTVGDVATGSRGEEIVDARAGGESGAGGDGEAVSEAEQAGDQDAGGQAEELPAEAAEALTNALDTLRESVADLHFGLDLPGVDEARQAQADLLAQLEGYVLPRVRTSAAPALIVVAGSTGAGKSTLVNTLAEKTVSRTGVRRPTTGTPVLACHPDDRAWFAEGELLGDLQRLDAPTPDAGPGSLVVVSTEKLPQGVALLDTPDIDSVVEEHHDIAHRMLDAADLWIFVTTAARYADAPAWNLLRLAKERGARLAIVLSRVQPRSADVVLKHFVRMLTEYGMGDIDRFVINEAKVADGRLPDSEVTELRLWLAELSVDEDRRAQAVRETLNGVLDSFRTRVPALAKHLEGQVAFRTELRSDVEAAFRGALTEIDKAYKNGSLLHGEVLARWQDFAGSGDLMRSLQLRRRGKAAKQAPERVLAFKAAIRTGLESVIVAAAHRASEEVVARWRHRSELGAKISEGLDSPSDNLIRHTGRAIASWQDHLGELVRTEGVAKRSVSKLVSFDPDSLALIFMVAMFSGSNGEGVPHRLVNALLGAESLRGIGAKALSDLRTRISMLFDEEAMRYVKALDSAGIPDESVATRLYQATYNLEVAR
ncbi:dynamin family protein [Nonomuraea sp. KM88]|uniref:dynamin family protein n=1 Tax=Nonomuraea sp. KM88 TaxID=3457427 RepID=UPI003FCE311B